MVVTPSPSPSPHLVLQVTVAAPGWSSSSRMAQSRSGGSKARQSTIRYVCLVRRCGLFRIQTVSLVRDTSPSIGHRRALSRRSLTTLFGLHSSCATWLPCLRRWRALAAFTVVATNTVATEAAATTTIATTTTMATTVIICLRSLRPRASFSIHRQLIVAGRNRQIPRSNDGVFGAGRTFLADLGLQDAS